MNTELLKGTNYHAKSGTACQRYTTIFIPTKGNEDLVKQIRSGKVPEWHELRQVKKVHLFDNYNRDKNLNQDGVVLIEKYPGDTGSSVRPMRLFFSGVLNSKDLHLKSGDVTRLSRVKIGSH